MGKEGVECFSSFLVLFVWFAWSAFSFGCHGCNVDQTVLVCLIFECGAASVILCCLFLVNLYMYTNIYIYIYKLHYAGL